MILTSNIPLYETSVSEDENPTTYVTVFLPTDSKKFPFVKADWEASDGDETPTVQISNMKTPAGLRRQGIARRLTQSLLRHTTLVNPKITTVQAWCTSPHSLKLMHGLFPNSSTIWFEDSAPTPDTELTLPQALGLMALWDIPENEQLREYGMSISANLSSVGMGRWELPIRAN